MNQLLVLALTIMVMDRIFLALVDKAMPGLVSGQYNKYRNMIIRFFKKFGGQAAESVSKTFRAQIIRLARWAWRNYPNAVMGIGVGLFFALVCIIMAAYLVS